MGDRWLQLYSPINGVDSTLVINELPDRELISEHLLTFKPDEGEEDFGFIPGYVNLRDYGIDEAGRQLVLDDIADAPYERPLDVQACQLTMDDDIGQIDPTGLACQNSNWPSMCFSSITDPTVIVCLPVVRTASLGTWHGGYIRRNDQSGERGVEHNPIGTRFCSKLCTAANSHKE